MGGSVGNLLQLPERLVGHTPSAHPPAPRTLLTPASYAQCPSPLIGRCHRAPRPRRPRVRPHTPNAHGCAPFRPTTAPGNAGEARSPRARDLSTPTCAASGSPWAPGVLFHGHWAYTSWAPDVSSMGTGRTTGEFPAGAIDTCRDDLDNVCRPRRRISKNLEPPRRRPPPATSFPMPDPASDSAAARSRHREGGWAPPAMDGNGPVPAPSGPLRRQRLRRVQRDRFSAHSQDPSGAHHDAPVRAVASPSFSAPADLYLQCPRQATRHGYLNLWREGRRSRRWGIGGTRRQPGPRDRFSPGPASRRPLVVPAAEQLVRQVSPRSPAGSSVSRDCWGALRSRYARCRPAWSR
jgi:hypothetical protein